MLRVEQPVDITTVETHFTDLKLEDEESFFRFAQCVIKYQRENNSVYRRFADFQFLPVEAFKRTKVTCFPSIEAEAVFRSSGTAATTNRSSHYVKSLDVYERSVLSNFEATYGTGPFSIIACLPVSADTSASSSLVVMAGMLIERFGTPASSFIGADADSLRGALRSTREFEAPIFLFGLAFGLLELVEAGDLLLPQDSVVLETGGMKTHRREISRKELHRKLSNGFGVSPASVRSEYGMCELLSQCYTKEDGLFYPPPWVQFRVFDTQTPEKELAEGELGALAVIDLANMYSVSSILTQDSAIRIGNGFDLVGRLSGAEMRGCNFLLENI